MNPDGVLDRVDILGYIGQYVEMSEDSGEWFGLCPFHNDSDPSFSVSPETGAWYCFGCKKGGNAISFVMKYHHIGYEDALERLCESVGITKREAVQQLEVSKTLRQYLPPKKKYKQATYKILEPNYMSRFDINWEKLKVWEEEGIPRELMTRFQVRYDPLGNRIVFPIRSPTGAVINVCGRTLNIQTHDSEGRRISKYKYLQKMGILDTIYALWDSKEKILEKKEIILFEGAKSVMKAYSYGYKNSAAVLTSGINQYQLKLLIKLGVRVVFALDSDVDVTKDKQVQWLKRFVTVETVYNYGKMLSPKMAPVDAGSEVWKTLYERRKRLN